MRTIGNESLGLRMTRGKLDRSGVFHDDWPDIFGLWRNRRMDGTELRYETDKRIERFCMWLAHRMPARLRMWAVVDATNEARRLYPHPTGYAGPDGLGYAHIHDGALRRRTGERDEPPIPRGIHIEIHDDNTVHFIGKGVLRYGRYFHENECAHYDSSES